MDELVSALQSFQSPARVQNVLQGLHAILTDVINHPTDESYRQVSRAELPGIGIQLLLSCGFTVDPNKGNEVLVLPQGADLSRLCQAHKEIANLLLAGAVPKAHVQPAAPPAPPKPATSATAGPVGAAPGVALALKLAAASLSPAVGLRSEAPYPATADEDALMAAPPAPPKSRLQASLGNSADDGAKQLTRTVPPSLASAAAAVGAAIGQGQSLSLGAAGLPGTTKVELAGSTMRPQGSGCGGAGSGAGAGRGAGGAGGAAGGAGGAGGAGTGGSGGPGGASTWTAAPVGTTPEDRLVVDLPETEFTYIERPWAHFVTRWAAIDVELERAYGEAPFTLLDLGSCCGFFSLQAAAGYPEAIVMGIEGSVGIGNGTTGVRGTEDEIVATKAVQTHLHWIEKLNLPNSLVVPEVWDYRRVCQLAALGKSISDTLLSLSVIHHIDNISKQLYTAARLSEVEGTLSLMANLLLLAPRHFVELPDRPWIEHVYVAYGNARAFLQAACDATGRRWSFTGPLCVSEWYGHRELWLIEEVGAERGTMPWQGLKALFPRVLGLPAGAPQVAAATMASLSSGCGGGAAQMPGATMPTTPAPLPAPQVSSSGLTREELGAALLAAPTALIASHVQLRDALAAAEITLRDVSSVAR